MAVSAGKGAEFVRWFGPVIRALHFLGGSGRASEVRETIVVNENVQEETLSQTLRNGASRFANQVDWARYYLAQTGYLDSSTYGVWALTEKGREIQSLSRDESLRIYYSFEEARLNKAEENSVSSTDTDTDSEAPSLVSTTEDYKSELLAILRNLPPSGFESLCQRLLRESGFERVEVTGKSGDGGIDGIGILQINPFVSFKVLFQCKRYTGSVGAGMVRDFRGSMEGRADKGIIITTGSFTSDARLEANRDGAVPIELVDSDQLIRLFESISIALKPIVTTTYEVNQEFFKQYSGLQ